MFVTSSDFLIDDKALQRAADNRAFFGKNRQAFADQI